MKLRWLLAFLVADVLWTVLGAAGAVPWSLAFPVLVAVALVAGTGLLTDLEKPKERKPGEVKQANKERLVLWRQGGADVGYLTESQLEELKLKLQESLKQRSPVVLSPPVTAAPAVTAVQKQEPLPVVGIDLPGEDYVPDGQDELSASLLEFLWDQVKEAEAHRIGPQRAWHVSPEWLEEVARIRAPDGKPAWSPRKRVVPPGKLHTEFLFGYPVITGDALGPPELREL